MAWGGRTNNDRGEEILDWTIINGWTVENGPQDPPSFHSNRGESWPDLVLTKGLRVLDRTVDEDEETLSDHRYIRYDIPKGRILRDTNRWRYDVKEANWDRLRDTLVDEMDGQRQNLDSLNAEDSGTLLQEIMERACGRVLRKKRRNRREENDWWDGDLDTMRRETRRARTEYQESRGDERNRMRLRYILRRNEYKRLIKERKVRQMEEELDRIGDNVWDVCRRWIKGGSGQVKGNYKRGDGTYTQTLDETYEELVRKYFPDGDRKRDMEGHIRMRMDYNRYVDGREDLTVTETEMRGAVEGMSKGKAPGRDGVPNECMEGLLTTCTDEWRRTLHKCMRGGVFPKVWKKAEVVLIPKGGRSHETNLSSIGW